MFRHATGIQTYPLKSGSSDAPVPAAGGNTTFQLDSIPIRNGKLAYYMPGIVVTVKGTFTQAGGAGEIVRADAFKRLLMDSIELRNCWHGTPVKSTYFLGKYLPITEFIGCGFRYAARQRQTFPATDGANLFSITFMIPLCVGTNVRPMQTSQLALFYREGELVLNWSAASVATAISPGSSVTFSSVRASAVLYPHKDLWLASGSEWVFYESTASSGQSQIELKSFGNTTGFNGVENNAGVISLLALASDATYSDLALGGSFNPNTVTKYNFPWRGQVDTGHPESVFAVQPLLSMGPQRHLGEAVGASTYRDYSGFPFFDDNPEAATSTFDMDNQYGIWLVFPQLDMELSKVQLAYGNPAYFLTATFAGSQNRTLSQQLKSWTEDKVRDAAHQINASGLARAVRGGDVSDWKARGAGGSMMAQEGDDRFLPLYFK